MKGEVARKPPRQSRKDQDLPLKLRVASALAISGYYSRINVNLSATSGLGLSDVTDVDVLATRYDVTFKQDAIAISCKSGEAKGRLSHEIFYLRGVLNYVQAENGVVVFSRKSVAPQLRDLGRRLNVLVLGMGELEDWSDTLTKDLPDPGYFAEASYEEYLKTWTKISDTGLGEYLRFDYWFHFDFRNLQNIIAHLRKVASRLNGNQSWHSTIFLDTAAHLCLTVFDLCREIRMLGLISISETTAAYLFGGPASFKARRDLYAKVQELLASTGVIAKDGPGLPPLEPTYAKTLAELTVRFIERPHAAVLVPQILQDNLWRTLGAKGAAEDDKNYLAAEKLTQDLLDFLKGSTGAPWAPKI
jgi:hypothetical protein